MVIVETLTHTCTHAIAVMHTLTDISYILTNENTHYQTNTNTPVEEPGQTNKGGSYIWSFGCPKAMCSLGATQDEVKQK